MALVLITILALIVMIITCLPIIRRSFNKYLEKMGYWSLLIIFIVYVFFDIWLWLKTSNITTNFWLSFIMSNIAGIVALFRTYLDIKHHE
ncbi:hypothetical protein B6C82_08525 [Lactobacillus crispatus]|nr:hypothetical protein [Lactobacillus crispatus]ORE81348.1 hypothetical protein B6C82_08525 [Lactobacillus crispatus]